MNITLAGPYTPSIVNPSASLPLDVAPLFEMIEGEVFEKMGSFIPSSIAAKLIHYLLTYLDSQPSGYVTGADGMYILSEENKFMPDVAYIRRERLGQLPEREVHMAPDLAVEIFSPNDVISQTQKKARLYLEHGTQLVWIIYPGDRRAEVCRLAPGGMQISPLTSEQNLSGEDLLPGFSLPLAKLFP
jgi:Uma2 family endonuclease